MNDVVRSVDGSVTLNPLSRAWPDLDTIDLAGREALRHVGYLRERSAMPDPAAAMLAEHRLARIRAAAMPPGEALWSGSGRLHWSLTVAYRLGRMVEDRLVGVFDPLVIRRVAHSSFARRWTLLRACNGLITSILVVTGLFIPAAVTLALRLAVSIVTGSSWSLPAEDPRSGPGGPQRIFACLAGHFSDTVILGAVALALFAHQRMVWGALVLGAIVVQLLATVLRVSVIQVGVVLLRLRLERVMRAGSMLVALGLAGILRRHGGEEPGAVLALLVAVPAFAYAFVEVLRTYARLGFSVGQPVSLLVGSEEVWRSVPDRPLRVVGE
jgi:hypothetical protein